MSSIGTGNEGSWMFVSLGLRNAWRNRGRTMLGIVSMALATIVFASSATLSQGYPSGAYFPARQLLGADLVLLPGKTVISRDDLASSNWTWRFGRTSLDRPNSTLGFNVTPYYYGSMQGEPQTGQIPGPADIKELAIRLEENPGVRHVSLKMALPFLYTYYRDEVPMVDYGFLEPRDPKIHKDTWRIEEVVDPRGRYLDSSDRASMVGVACSGWKGASYAIGQNVNLQIPNLFMSADGKTYYDYENSLDVDLRIVGAVAFKDGEGASSTTYANPTIFVTPETFSDLCKMAGFEPDDTLWGIGVAARNMSSLENLASSLQREFPQYSVFTAPGLANASSSQTPLSTGVPMDMRRVTEALAFLVAALLSATNLTVLMLTRKTEIGILRSLGATRWNITCMVLTESVWIALLGSVMGNLLTQPAIFWNLVSDGMSSGAVLGKAATTATTSLGFALLAAVIFGFLPVTKALRVTPAEVLRGQ
jgi:hypothetical protein